MSKLHEDLNELALLCESYRSYKVPMRLEKQVAAEMASWFKRWADVATQLSSIFGRIAHSGERLPESEQRKISSIVRKVIKGVDYIKPAMTAVEQWMASDYMHRRKGFHGD